MGNCRCVAIKIKNREYEIIKENLLMFKDEEAPILELVKRQEQLISEFISLGHEREEFFELSRKMAEVK